MSRFAITFAALVLVGLGVRATSTDPLFVAATSVDVGPGSGEVALVDLNRDGHLDLVTKHLLTRRIKGKLGDGRGQFAVLAGGPMRLDYEPGAMALGDVNGDSTLDLVVARKDPQKEYIHVFLGKGDGRFVEAGNSPYTTSAAFEFYKPIVRIVDVNKDGARDIVAANGRRNSLELLFGDGRGTFSTGPVLSLEAGPGVRSFAFGDVDGDGHLDLVTTGNGSRDHADRLLVMRGNSRGNFDTAAQSSTVAAGPRILALTDLNGDRVLDVVLGHAEQHQVSVLLGGAPRAGTPTFTPAPRSPYAIDSETFAVVVADANRDARADILAATVNSVTALLGDGKVFAPAPGSPFRAGPGAFYLASGDVNEDGKLDLVASSFEGDAVALLLGR